jgi:hypothetical protein
MTTPRNTPKTGTWAEVLADSVAPGCPRLTSLKVRFPHIILPQRNTHRIISKTDEGGWGDISRSDASSRAIPIQRLISAVEADPYIPTSWRYAADRGMQPGELMSDEDADESREDWRDAMRFNLSRARKMAKRGNAKEDANRLLEPFAYVTSIMTATDWENWEGLRLDAHSQVAIRDLAVAIRDAMAGSKPRKIGVGGWHMPYFETGYPDESAACCARISYDSHDGGRATRAANGRLADLLKREGHWSPFEHIAFADAEPSRHGNLSGNWAQYRKIMGA